MRTRMMTFIAIALTTACSTPTMTDNMTSPSATRTATEPQDSSGLSTAYFASGCFWCVEGVYQSVKGVSEVVSGYSGGKVADPTYEMVSSGSTGHAETVKVIYDPKQVTYGQLLEVFYDSHDPTTKDAQGPDHGTQYRSMIFHGNEAEKQEALAYIKKLEDAKAYDTPIVTEVVPFEKFWPAEKYHQDYVGNNPFNPYVQNVSIPRCERFKQKRPDLVK
ncbi:MAG: peptide-methionine (S)-S-oxide reductase MsrA [Flavobacteriales bacterium]